MHMCIEQFLYLLRMICLTMAAGALMFIINWVKSKNHTGSVKSLDHYDTHLGSGPQ